MKRIVITLLAIFFGFQIMIASNKDSGKKIICGKVIDKVTGEALAGVKIEIKGTGTYCYTDLNGGFVLSVQIDSKQEVEANVVGYKQAKLTTNELCFNKDISLSPVQ